jgi:uncharacterized phage protein gp47/JayE
MSDIYSRLVDNTITNTKEINDFSVGSAMRAIYEAISIELEQFYIITRENIAESIEAGVYSSFGFTRQAAVKAYGNMQITFNSATTVDLYLSRGSRFTSSNPSYSALMYETIQDYTIPAGSLTATVQIYCTLPGALGNVPASVIDTMSSPLQNVKSVTNPAAFQTGQDQEPLSEMRARFAAYIESLSKGTVPAIEYGTRSVTNVSGVYVDEQTGLIVVYAHDRNGDLPSDLQANIVSNLDNYRAGGIPVQVKPVIKVNQDVSVTVTLTNKSGITQAFNDKINSTISTYLNNMTTSQSLILSDLTSIIKYVDRVLIYDVQYTNLTGNVILDKNEVMRAGTITVTLQ